MMLQEISDYKRKLRLYINGFAFLGAAGFAILQLSTSHPNMGIASALSAVYFALISHYLYKDGRYLWDGRGVLAVLPPTVFLAMHANPDFGIYWAYVGVVGLFLMLRLKDASISSIVFIAVSFYLVGSHFSTEVLYRIFGTLTLVAVFSYCFSYLIDRLLDSVNAVATHDPLTKALNRHTFNKSIEEALKDHRRHHVIAVLFLFDLDFFKKINDQHGHLVGDEILKEIATIVRKRVRETDQFFRYGGEEFAILLRHTRLQNAAHVADEIRALVESHTFVNGIKVTISGGLAEVHESTDVIGWIDRSDQALYEAKSSGRNCIKIYVPKLEGWDE